VHVGPDCTCVKSRMRTPSSALPMLYLLSMLKSGRFTCTWSGFVLPVAGFRDETTADIVVSWSVGCSTLLDGRGRFDHPLREVWHALLHTVCDISHSIKADFHVINRLRLCF
jgi:hypothetical protein